MILERLSWRVTCVNQRFLRIQDLDPYPVIGLELHAGDADKFPQALNFENVDFFSESSGKVHVSQL